MKLKLLRISATGFVLICIIVLIAINLIPRGNFHAAPAITLYLYFPLIIVQIILMIQIWNSEKKKIVQ